MIQSVYWGQVGLTWMVTVHALTKHVVNEFLSRACSVLYLHLPLALLQRGRQLLILLQQSLAQLGGQDQIRLDPSSTVAAAGSGPRWGESKGEGDRAGRGQREERVLQAGWWKTGFPRSEHFSAGSVTEHHKGSWRTAIKFLDGLVQIGLMNLLSKFVIQVRYIWYWHWYLNPLFVTNESVGKKTPSVTNWINVFTVTPNFTICVIVRQVVYE